MSDVFTNKEDASPKNKKESRVTP